MIYKRGKLYYMDVTINGVRYREALDTTDRREAPSLEKKRVAEIQAGKGASKSSRTFARKPFVAAADEYLEDRKPHVADRTYVLERNLLSPLRRFFGERLLLRITAENIAAYQRERRGTGISGRTLNMEIGILRRIMKRAKIWSVVAEDVKMDRESTSGIGKVLTVEEKKILFETAAAKEDWRVVYCAAVLAVSTTCRGVELKHLRWGDVDLFDRSMLIRRSKTKAGRRAIPLNTDAVAALAQLRQRAEADAADAPEHFVFPACQRNIVDPTRPQKTWRTAWRSIVRAAAVRAGREAAAAALASGKSLASAIGAWRWAAKPIRGLRFHDLRHQAITELAEGGAPDATLMALAGHLSREMMEHYSHVRMAAKREALDRLSGGLISHPEAAVKLASDRVH